MEHLWTPWRYSYVTDESETRKGVPTELSAWPGDKGCLFCNMIAATDYAIAQGMQRDEAERASGIVARGDHVYVCLNRFPYNSGHIMVVPYEHLASLAALPTDAAHELIDFAQHTEHAYARTYHPHGMNLGLNLGKAAGAGVAEHLHLHALPRWLGDTNFMTVTGDTRVLPEELGETWMRLREAFAQKP